MARKKVVLAMTLGVDDELNTVAIKAVASIQHVRPDYIIFFTSEQSKFTIETIKELVKDDYDEFIEGEDYEVNIIKDIDSFNECYYLYFNKFNEFWNQCKLIVDYTSGTRTMSASLAVACVFYEGELISVGGLRENGFVKKGTETIRSHNVYSVRDNILLYYIIKMFNDYRYDTALEIVDSLVSPKMDKENIKKIIQVYSYWDKVQFNEARELLKEANFKFNQLDPIRKTVKDNIKALSIICTSNSDNLRNCYILASLINNARRRAEEFKYDDAIARLYRSFELIAQIKLNQYNLKSSDIDINILKEKNVSEEFLNHLEKTREDGKIRIGLVNDYLLLNELNEDLGKFFVENRKTINNITVKRNNSILAHGISSLSKEDFETFEALVVELALKLDKSMKRFLFETEFPKYIIE